MAIASKIGSVREGQGNDTDNEAAYQAKEARETVGSSPSKLLSLPPELRDKVYKYCLIADDKDDTEIPMYSNKRGFFILITENLKPPALLAVCRQIRKETKTIFYTSNRFHVDIPYYDTTLYTAWRIHIRNIGYKTKASNVAFRVLGGPNWENLKIWCRHVWSGLPAISRVRGHVKRKHEIVDAAHRIAVASRGKPWVECEVQLDGWRRVLGQVDRTWLD